MSRGPPGPGTYFSVTFQGPGPAMEQAGLAAQGRALATPDPTVHYIQSHEQRALSSCDRRFIASHRIRFSQKGKEAETGSSGRWGACAAPDPSHPAACHPQGS